MKNLYFILLSLFLFVSCSSDLESLVESGDSEIVSIDLTIPSLDDMKTRAYADGNTVKYLKCYVYDHDAGENALPFSTQDIEIKTLGSKRGNHFDITLVKDKTYDLVFLATAVDQTDPNTKVYYNPTLRTLNVNYSAVKTNDEELDCFFGVLTDLSTESEKAQSVILKRPFAQLNIGTKDLADYNKLAASSLKTVGLSVDGVYSSMNLMDGKVIGNPVKAVFEPNAIPSGETFPVADCNYLAMDYLLVNERKNVSVSMAVSNGTSSYDANYADVPVQRNCQTNIYGNLLTEENSFKVEIITDFGGSSNKDMDDKWADYDLVLETYSDTYDLEIWYTQNGVTRSCSLKKYRDNNNYIKVTWDELGIKEPISFYFRHEYGSSAQNLNLKALYKCDIGDFPIKSLAGLFRNGIYLENVEALKSWDTSEIENMSSMFSGCSKLTVLDLSNFDTSNVTNMSGMFKECSSIKNLDISSFDTSNVTTMSNMFYRCTSLPSLDVSNFDTSMVTNMAYMFYQCKSLPTLDLSNFDTSTVTNMAYMFYQCKSLPTLDVSNFDTSRVTNMSSMFASCSSLPTLDLSNFDTSEVTTMSSMFSECNNLQHIDVSNFDTSKVEYMSNMFYRCTSLPSLDISNFDTSKVTDMSYMFYYCTSLPSLDISNFNTSSVTDMSRMFYYCISIPVLDVSNFDTSNVTTMKEMFYYCTALQELDVSKFDTSNVKDMSYMFYYCKSIPTLDVSEFDTSSVTTMSDMFCGCSSLPTLDVSNFDTLHVTNMSGMFANCSSLPTLYVSNFNTSMVTDMAYMFSGCKSLPTLDVSNFDTSRVKDMSGMFQHCSSLPTLDLSNFDTSMVTDMYRMFANCSKLSDLNLNGFNFAKVTRYYLNYETDYIFYNTPNLKSITGSVSNINENLIIHSPLDNESAMVFINGLKEVSSSKTITFKTATYNTLSADQIKIATDKGWVVKSAA